MTKDGEVKAILNHRERHSQNNSVGNKRNKSHTEINKTKNRKIIDLVNPNSVVKISLITNFLKKVENINI